MFDKIASPFSRTYGAQRGSPFGNPGGEAARSPRRAESAERWIATFTVYERDRRSTHRVFAMSL
jgi:hypothetical protein